MSTYHRNNIPTEVVGQPRRVKTKQGTAYTFLIHGVLYYFFVSHKIRAPFVLEAAPNDKGEMRLIHMPEEDGKRLLNAFFGKPLFV